jgi:hypothetical protein
VAVVAGLAPVGLTVVPDMCDLHGCFLPQHTTLEGALGVNILLIARLSQEIVHLEIVTLCVGLILRYSLSKDSVNISLHKLVLVLLAIYAVPP